MRDCRAGRAGDAAASLVAVEEPRVLCAHRRVTRKDHQLRIYNGDIGVVIATGDGLQVAFPTATSPSPPSRLEAVETVHAMTIHKSQGSQSSHSVVVLPTKDSLILSRELLYTGVDRAVDRVTVIASEPAIRAGVERQVRRASGLRHRPWPHSVTGASVPSGF